MTECFYMWYFPNLQIQGGDTDANAKAGTLSIVNRFCGRELLPARDTAWSAAITSATAVCCTYLLYYNLKNPTTALNKSLYVRFLHFKQTFFILY